jgi:uncharacterized protein YtpQ (UPF0354 family)
MDSIMKFIFTLCLWFATTAAFAAQMSESQFTEAFAKQAKASIKDVNFKIVQPLQINTKNVNGYELTIFLGNAYAQYTSSPSNLQSIIDSQISSIKSQQQILGSQTSTAIFAVLKPADYLATVKKQLSQTNLAAKDIPLVFDKINDDLYVFYVFDTENGMRMITKKDLADSKVEEKSVRAIAVKNLSDYFAKKQVAIRRIEKTGTAKVYAVSLDENYEASILLLDKYWNKRTFDVSGDIVAFFPARNVVLVTGSSDKEGLRIAGYLANSGFKELGYAISPNGFKYNAGAWGLYQP